MTREQVKKLFPEATEEQINALLDANSADIGKAKKFGISEEELSGLRVKAKAYEDYEDSKKTADEKLQKLLADAEKSKLENLKLLNKTKAASAFVAAGISEEEYSSFIDGIVSDSEENTIALANNLVSVFKTKVENAEKNLKAELLKDTPLPPVGGNGALSYDKQIEDARESGNMALVASLIRQQALKKGE